MHEEEFTVRLGGSLINYSKPNFNVMASISLIGIYVIFALIRYFCIATTFKAKQQLKMDWKSSAKYLKNISSLTRWSILRKKFTHLSINSNFKHYIFS